MFRISTHLLRRRFMSTKPDPKVPVSKSDLYLTSLSLATTAFLLYWTASDYKELKREKHKNSRIVL